MRKKAKALKAVEPNAGVRKAYTKAVTKIERDFQSYVLNRVLLFLESKHVLAEDSELTTKTPEERQKEKLEADGIEVTDYKVDLKKYQWKDNEG